MDAPEHLVNKVVYRDRNLSVLLDILYLRESLFGLSV
jgi:hypothetical protein